MGKKKDDVPIRQFTTLKSFEFDQHIQLQSVVIRLDGYAVKEQVMPSSNGLGMDGELFSNDDTSNDTASNLPDPLRDLQYDPAGQPPTAF